MDAISSSTTSSGAGSAIKPTIGEPGRILLIELINLLSLFFIHTRNSKGARATAVLFDQIVQRLNILDKMPGHESGIIIRRIGHSASGFEEKPDYFLSFGHMAFRGSEAIVLNGPKGKSSHVLGLALEQALACFNELGMYSFFLQLPGKSSTRIDQLRLALNILARFRSSVGLNSSITFRYFGRAMAIPLIRGSEGIPDPNLTLVAGLNGLSAVNMREIVKQAVAFCSLSPPQDDMGCISENYNKIFRVRSLRSQLVQPLIEINNLPWMNADEVPVKVLDEAHDIPGVSAHTVETAADGVKKVAVDRQISSDLAVTPDFDLMAADLNSYLGASDQEVARVMDTLLDFDFDQLSPEEFGNHVKMVSQLLHRLSAGHSTPPLTPLLNFLRDRIEQFPEDILSCISVQRQGLRVELQGRKFIVGMVHPQLLNLVSFVKDRIELQYKIDVVRDFGPHLLGPDNNDLVRRFSIVDKDADRVKSLLAKCFNDKGRFLRAQFTANADKLSAYGNTLFEILWCILRQTSVTQDRLALINAIPLLTERLRDTQSALTFLLSDLFKDSKQVELSDRNAFALATIMLRTHNKERNIDIDSTPEEVLAVRKSLNKKLLRSTAERLATNAVRVRSKFYTIREVLAKNVTTYSADATTSVLSFKFLLALEREGLIFMALVGTPTAHVVISDALAYYGDPSAPIYQKQLSSQNLLDVMGHLRIVLKCIARLGEQEDLEKLKVLERAVPRLMALNTDPAYTQAVRQTLKWAEPAIRAIQVNL